MLRTILERIRQGHRTIAYPEGAPPSMPPRFRGLPKVDSSKCPDDCRECADACPTDAITVNGAVHIDLGRCLFCNDCAEACPERAIAYTSDFRLASRTREGLIVRDDLFERAAALEARSRKLFGRSLQLRQVSAGGCNGCESDINVLGTVGFDLGRFGISIVASPRHADGLLVTGPVTENMKLALRKTYDAMPAPKLVIAVGACAISGGPYMGHSEQSNGVDAALPVDLYIPGCPPHPLTILDGLLRLLGKLESEQERS